MEKEIRNETFCYSLGLALVSWNKNFSRPQLCFPVVHTENVVELNLNGNKGMQEGRRKEERREKEKGEGREGKG